MIFGICFKMLRHLGQPGWLRGLAPPLDQGLILETRDRVPCQAPYMEPASPSASVSASLSMTLMNKEIKSFKQKPTNLKQRQ